MFGWDWGPALPAIGIWRDIRLEAWSIARLDDVHLRQAQTSKGVNVSAAVTIERWTDGPLKIGLEIVAPDGKQFTDEANFENDSTIVEVLITDPELWWPNS